MNSAYRLGSLLAFGCFLLIGSIAHAQTKEQYQTQVANYQTSFAACQTETSVKQGSLDTMSDKNKRKMVQCLRSKGTSERTYTNAQRQLQQIEIMENFSAAVDSCQASEGVVATSLSGLSKADQKKMLKCLNGKGYKNKRSVARLAQKLDALRKQQAKKVQEIAMDQCMSAKGYTEKMSSAYIQRKATEQEKQDYKACQEAAKNATVVTAASAAVDASNTNTNTQTDTSTGNSNVPVNNNNSGVQ